MPIHRPITAPPLARPDRHPGERRDPSDMGLRFAGMTTDVAYPKGGRIPKESQAGRRLISPECRLAPPCLQPDRHRGGRQRARHQEALRRSTPSACMRRQVAMSSTPSATTDNCRARARSIIRCAKARIAGVGCTAAPRPCPASAPVNGRSSRSGMRFTAGADVVDRDAITLAAQTFQHSGQQRAGPRPACSRSARSRHVRPACPAARRCASSRRSASGTSSTSSGKFSADVEGMRAQQRTRHVGQRAADNDVGQMRGEAGILDLRHEGAGRQRAVDRVVEPGERFQRHRSTVRNADDRLVAESRSLRWRAPRAARSGAWTCHPMGVLVRQVPEPAAPRGGRRPESRRCGAAAGCGPATGPRCRTSHVAGGQLHQLVEQPVGTVGVQQQMRVARCDARQADYRISGVAVGNAAAELGRRRLHRPGPAPAAADQQQIARRRRDHCPRATRCPNMSVQSVMHWDVIHPSNHRDRHARHCLPQHSAALR